MEIVRTKSFIIKKIPIKEYDALVFLFTDTIGKVVARAKSGFKKDTKWTSIIETMNLIDTSLYKKRDYYYLTETKVIESFLTIKRDLNRSLVALQVLDLIDKTQVENNSNNNLFNALFDFFNKLKTFNNYNSLFINFIFNFIKIEGVQFPFDKCIKCSEMIKEEYTYDFNLNGFVCSSHRTKNFIELNKNLYEKIMMISLNYEESIVFERDELEIIYLILSSFLENNFGFKFKNYFNKIFV
ncbi:MAG: DNA repair protein RecO [Caldisericia bacterium]|jgi:DNA repair protein RecO (recombination protein O)|nr:DNA repair protein RecO [Caldisericia bacterium]